MSGRGPGGGRDVNLTDGPLVKPLFALSLPIVASQMMQVAYNLADTFWVGRLGPDPVSALSFAWPIVFLVISVASGFSIAGTALVAQHKGAGNLDQVDHVAGQTVGLVLVGSALLSLVGYALAPSLVSLIGAEPGSAVHALTVEYVRTLLLGAFFVFGFFVFQALLRGWGDTKTPMYLMAFGVTLNLVVDPFLVLGFQGNPLFDWLGMGGLQTSLFAATGFEGFGVQGAAIATVFARGTAAVVGLWLLFSGRIGISPDLGDLVPNPATVKKVVRIGAPASVDMSTRALGITAMTAVVAIAGTDTVAAFGIGGRITSLVFLPAIGLAQGTATAVGQNLGADSPDRAKRAVGYAAAVLAAVLAVVSVFAYLYAGPIFDVFIQGEGAANVVAIGTEFLRIVAPTFVFLGVFRILAGTFQGSGDTQIAMALTVVSLWVFRIPVAYGLITWTDLGATGVWYAIAFSNVATVVVAIAWFLRGTWTDAVVDDTGGPAALGDGDGPDAASGTGSAPGDVD